MSKKYDKEYYHKVQYAKSNNLTTTLERLKPDCKDALRVYNEIKKGTVVTKLNSQYQQIFSDQFSAWFFKGHSLDSYGIKHRSIVVIENNELRRDSYNSLVLCEFNSEVYLRFYDGYTLRADSPFPVLKINQQKIKQIGIPIFVLDPINEIFEMDTEEKIERYMVAMKGSSNKLISRFKL